MAQEIETEYPELVRVDPSTGFKSVEYGNLVAPLIESVKTLKLQLDAQRKEIDDLKSRIAK